MMGKGVMKMLSNAQKINVERVVNFSLKKKMFAECKSIHEFQIKMI